MRTTFLLGILLVMSFATPLVGASEPVPDVVEETLEGLGLDLRGKDGSSEEEAESSGPADGTKIAATAAVVTAPVDVLTRSLIELGLTLLGGFFTGVASGTSTLVHAAAVTAAAPLESLAIAAATLAIAGLLSSLAMAIQRYGSLGAIPLFSRIARDAIFENKVRSDIFELIRSNPGINVSEISRRLDVAWGTATHHLQKLRAERMVGIRVVGHQKCYFPNGGAYTPREMEVMSATKNATARRIAEFVSRSGPTPHRDVAVALGLSPALVSFHARKLEEAGVVQRRREGRHTFFVALESNLSPTPRASVHTI